MAFTGDHARSSRRRRNLPSGQPPGSNRGETRLFLSPHEDSLQDNGVRVYVLVFKEVSFAMGLNSLHTKRALIGKSKRGFIKVDNRG